MLSADSKVRTLLYGLPNQNTINYFQEQMNKVNDVGSGFANWVRQGVTNMYNSVECLFFINGCYLSNEFKS